MHSPQHRRIDGLKYAAAVAGRPNCIPLSKPRGVKALGLAFERKLARALPSSIHGQWFEFEDALGFGYCQTDIIMPFLSKGFIAVIEVKYTLVPGAHSKLSGLYLPVVQAAFNMPAAGVVVVKNLDPRFRRGRIYTSLIDAAEAALDVGYPTLLQWSGQPLMHVKLQAGHEVPAATHTPPLHTRRAA
jgi:hypothetical protein